MNDIAREYYEFIKRVEYGEYEMVELIRFIQDNLLTEEQEMFLYTHKITLEGLLMGGWAGDLEPDIQVIFSDWNAKCGTNLFRIA